MVDDVPEQQRIRHEKRAALLAAGVDPYPVGVPRTHTLRSIRDTYDPAQLGAGASTGTTVSVTGRVIFLRNTGKLCFVRLREGDGTELQVMLAVGDIGPASLEQFKARVDIGDHLAVTGEVVTSRRGELSVRADAWQLAAKALRPLPVEHKPLTDEARVRSRHVDLIVRPQARDMVRRRARVLATIRAELDVRDFVEVETPLLHNLQGGAAARPFRTHFNAFDLDMTLRIALELHLKRAVIGGVERVYEIGRIFRNEGLDSTHHPEFTMLEAYEAYGDYLTMADLTQHLVVTSARAVDATVIPDGRGGEVDLTGTWQQRRLHDLVSEALAQEVTPQTPVDRLRWIAAERDIPLLEHWEAGDIVLELYEQLVEFDLLEPTFVMDYPRATRPLARRHRSTPGLAEAWDLVIAGVEIGTGYSELSDPVEQRELLVAQARRGAGGDLDAMTLDEDFLAALEYGMPPTGGMGLGIDRVLRLLSGTGIRDTILFPLVRPL